MEAVFLYMLNRDRLVIAVEEAEKRGKTKEDIASESDITVQTLYTYLRGKHDPTTRILGLLAKATGKTVGWLMGESIKNYQLSVDDAELADPQRMKLLERELEIITELRLIREKQIQSNTRSNEDGAQGT